MKSCGHSCEDAQDKDDWRLRTTGQPTDPGVPGKWPLNSVFVCFVVSKKTF